ncbi:MAG: hypothetical protein M1831_005957 [Alyxoria varia]|nr:MAG: hypothetical protein M1831_005957 [Alyxoria varia]
MLVSRSAMRRTCRAFSSMLQLNKWKEGQMDEVKLPEDLPDTIQVLARIAHMQFMAAGVKQQNSPRQLLHLAILCDKYDLAAPFEPFKDRWIASQNISGGLNQLFVCHALKQPDKFFEQAIPYIERMRVNHDKSQIYCGDLKLNDPQKEYISPVITKLMDIRHAAMETFRKTLLTYKDRVKTRWGACQAREGADNIHECNALLKLSYLEFLNHERINPDRTLPAQDGRGLKPSIQDFGVMINRRRVRSFGDEQNHIEKARNPMIRPPAQKGGDHADCNFTGKLQEAASQMMGDVERLLVERFSTHFRLGHWYTIKKPSLSHIRAARGNIGSARSTFEKRKNIQIADLERRSLT